MEVNMKKLFLISVIVASSVFAASVAVDFPAHKAKVLENSDKRIAAISEFKECANAAVDQNAMMVCRKTELNKIKALKVEMKADGCTMKGDMPGKMKGHNMSGMKNDSTGGKSCHACPTESNSTTK
jgi:hypothetical protein